MAREVIVSTWCDECLKSDLKNEGVTRADLQLGGIRAELDLCDECWDELSGRLRELMIEASQPIEQPKSKAQPIFECPVCDGQYVGRRGLQSHLKQLHDQDLALLEAAEGKTIDGRPIIRWCPDCGAGYGDTRGSVGHINNTGHRPTVDYPPEIPGKSSDEKPTKKPTKKRTKPAEDADQPTLSA